MGLFYSSYIKENKEAYNKSDFNNLDDFLISDIANNINREFSVEFGSLHWSLNIDKLYEELNEKPISLKETIQEPLDQNNDDWNNN